MKSFLISISLVLIVSCGESPKELPKEIDWNKEKSLQMNKDLAMEQEIEINLFLEQHSNWEMIKTGSGLQYTYIERGIGDFSQVGLTAEVEMVVSLLDGTECYKTEKDEYQEFVIDKSDIETGIQEGIKKMRIGDRVKMIIPSHLAHGLVGDLDKIPPLSVIVVDLHLIGLIK
jgi:FKBP-type peptidyl-prolyl cis-trans isomerase